MRIGLAFRVLLVVAASALALGGCVHRTGPVATRPAGGDLDTIAYGSPAYGSPASRGTNLRPPRANAPGALAALRNSMAAAPAAPPPVVMAAAPSVVEAPPSAPVRSYDAPYRLDTGDRLRIVVYGQEGLTNTYTVGASGSITMPLIGTVPARGQTPSQLAHDIAARLRKNFIRDPYVAAEIETYRPFFILGEVTAPGQYPYVPNMTAESAVAIAGGFSPRAKRDFVTITHPAPGGTMRAVVSPDTPINPGDTVIVRERWF